MEKPRQAEPECSEGRIRMSQMVLGPNMIDLFAGCGGLSLGLEMAGFTPLFVNELNPDAMETYLRNRDRHHPLLRKYNVHDVKELVTNNGALIDDLLDGFRRDYLINARAGEIDLLVGGPPCQGYSGIGHRRSYAVDKELLPSNHLYKDMAFAVRKIRPKLFLFENVKGLLSSKWTATGEKGEIWDDIVRTFSEIPEYTVRWTLVHAKDYGVPQNRPRVLLVGVRSDLGITPVYGLRADGFLPEPSDNYPNLLELLGDLVDLDYENGKSTTTYPNHASSAIQEWLRCDPATQRLRAKGSPVSEHEYSNHSPAIREKFAHMIANNGEIPERFKTKKFAQRVLPTHWGPSGPSITAASLADDYVHFSQPRALTVREWARLQTFPDWYEFAGKRTTGGIRRAGNPQAGIHDREVPKFTQIGNAVPVMLALAIGNQFQRLLSGIQPSLHDAVGFPAIDREFSGKAHTLQLFVAPRRHVS